MTAAMTLTSYSPTDSWEDLVVNELFVRDCIKLLIEGHSYRSISQVMGISRPTMDKVAEIMPKYVRQETRALAMAWVAVEFQRLESITRRCLPSVLFDEQKLANGDDQNVLNRRDVQNYKDLVSVKIALVALDRRIDSPDMPDDIAEPASATAVGRYVELVEKTMSGVHESGYGSGIYEAEDEDVEDEFELNRRADNSDTVGEAAAVLDPGGAVTDADLEPTGTWVDGKWVAL